MNFFLLNGATLNGAITGLVLATASVVCTASVIAEGVREARGVATGSAQVTIEAAPTHIKAISANVMGSGGLFPNGEHTHAAASSLGGSSDLLVYVLREVPAAATVLTGVEIIAVVASTQGNSVLGGDVVLIAEATRTQNISSTIGGAGTVAITTAPEIMQAGSALISNSGVLRGEASVTEVIDGITRLDGYFEPLCTAEITALAVCFKEGFVEVTGSTTTAAIATVTQMAVVTAAGYGPVLSADPFVGAVIDSSLSVNAELSAEPTAIRQALSAYQGTAEFSGNALVNHASAITLAGSSSISATLTLDSPMFATLQGVNTYAVSSLRIANGVVNAAATAQLSGAPSVNYTAYVDLLGTAESSITSEALNTRAVSGQSESLFGLAEITASPAVKYACYASLQSTVEVLTTSEDLNTRVKTGSASLSGLSTVSAVANNVHLSMCNVDTSSSLSVTAESMNDRRVLASSSLVGTTNLVASSDTAHAGSSNAVTLSDLSASAESLNTRSILATASISNSVQVTGLAGTVLFSFVNVDANGTSISVSEAVNSRLKAANCDLFTNSASVVCIGSLVKNAVSGSVESGVTLLVLADQTIRLAAASVEGTVNINSEPQGTSRNVSCVIEAGASVNPLATRVILIAPILVDTPQGLNSGALNGFAVGYISRRDHLPILAGSVNVYADTVANPESIDPEDRVFRRTAEIVDFNRPFIETEFKRAA